MAETRPPVIAIMGHIDHGKSTLIDHIRESNITTKEAGPPRLDARVEAGGITQHIGAYEVGITDEDKKGRKLTILDTPGHEAFGGIRERGAGAADIAVLIVAADDGVKPQTLEAADRIKKSSIPFIVAINKTDKAGADIERTKQSLAENDIYVEGYGGNVPFQPISAITGDGVGELIDMIFLLADLEEFKTDTDAPGEGVIIESNMDPRQGITSTGIIKNGTVRRGQFAASAGAIAPLRLILDSDGNQEEELSASSPVQIIGWDKMPRAGSPFKTFLKKEEALAYASESGRDSEVAQLRQGSDGQVGAQDESAETLPLVIKADAAGSLEAIMAEVGKLSRERIRPHVLVSGVGSVSEGDIKSALAAENPTVINFNTKVDNQAKALAERSGIPILSFSIIYELIDKVKSLLEEHEPRIEVEEPVGKAKILKTFGETRGKQVVGGRVLEGEMKQGSNIKIMRRESEVGRGKIKELQQAKLAVESVHEGNEFGAMVESKLDIAAGDVLEAFVLVTK